MGQVTTTELTEGQQNVTAAQINAIAGPIKNEVNGNLDNTNIKAGANIAYSKLALSGSIVNADVSSSAAIAHSKLADITGGYVLLGNSSNVPTATAVSGDITISNTGVTTIGNDKIDSQHYAAGSIDPEHIGTVFGSWGSATVGSSTQVSFDSLLVGYVTEDGSGTMTFTIKTDSSNPPTTTRVQITRSNASKVNAFMCPVKKNDYYLIEVANGTVTNADIIPIGA